MSHLPFMVLKRRIPSAGPQICIRSSLLILNRSAPATTAENLFCFLFKILCKFLFFPNDWAAQLRACSLLLFNCSMDQNLLRFLPLLPEKLEKSLEKGENLWRCSHCWVSCGEDDGRRCYMSKRRRALEMSIAAQHPLSPNNGLKGMREQH